MSIAPTTVVKFPWTHFIIIKNQLNVSAGYFRSFRDFYNFSICIIRYQEISFLNSC